ncbi:predicted protein [Chaetoceros tenuissimus]|uniref:Uncharacterized protein n=1 Tax=Chaetoceros tenuissimus TaxID=426638 RepID=A0AAD3DAX3_9STRA|nr:predicted protein [Chaetoceros tenuissimus]
MLSQQLNKEQKFCRLSSDQKVRSNKRTLLFNHNRNKDVGIHDSSLLKPKRPWTTPTGRSRPLLKQLYPEMEVEVKKLEKLKRYGTLLVPRRNSMDGGNIDNNTRGRNNVAYKSNEIQVEKGTILTLDLPKKLKKKSSKFRSRQNRKNNMQSSLHTPVRQLSRDLSSKRDDRILKAKKRREELQKSKMIKVKESLYKKESKRLQNIHSTALGIQKEKWLLAIVVGSSMERWIKDAPKKIESHQRNIALNKAASTIQIRWRREMFARKAYTSALIQQKLKKYKWKIILFARTFRRRFYSKVLRSFLLEISRSLIYLIMHHHSRVVKIQTVIRDYIRCKRCRLLALQRQWYRYEKEWISREEAKRMKKKRKNTNTLIDMSHRKILSKGIVGIVKGIAKEQGDEDSSSCDSMSAYTLTDYNTVRMICESYLLDNRRSYQEDIRLSSSKDQIYKVSINDVKELLFDGISDPLIKRMQSKIYPMFRIYSRCETLKKKITELHRKEIEGLDEYICRLERQKKIYSTFTSKKIEKVMGSRECKEEFSESSEISNVTLSELKEIFNLFDSSSRSYLIQKDFDRSYHNVGLSSSMFSTGQKSIDFHKFVSMVQTEFQESWTFPKETVVRALMYFRKQNNNFVDRNTLEILMNTYGEHWNEEFTRNVLDAVGIKHRLTLEMVENIYDVKSRGVNNIFNIKTQCA